MSLIKVFQIVLRGGGENPFPSEGKWEILLGVDFFIRCGHLKRSACDHSNPFQSKKHHSVNIEHQLKSKLARPWCAYKEYEVKNGAGAMATVKNEGFLGLLCEKFYLVGRKLTFGGGRKCRKF